MPDRDSDENEVAALRKRVRQTRLQARKIWRRAKDLLAGDSSDVALAAKLIAEHTKKERQADELQERLDNFARMDRFVAHDREMAGLGAGH